MINYLVCSISLTAYGSGVTSFIKDHINMIRNYTTPRIVIIDYSNGNFTLPVTFDAECVMITNIKDLPKDGIWYVHSPSESKLLQRLNIPHYYQLHHGDLFLGSKFNNIRKQLGIREQIEIEDELNTINNPLVTVIAQTKEMAERLKCKSLVAKPPSYSVERVDEKVYDLCITGSTNPFKCIYLPLMNLTLEHVMNNKIVVVASLQGQVGGPRGLDHITNGILDSFNVPNDIRPHIEWYFGIPRELANKIFSKSKSIIHPSVVECYPMVILESSNHVTVMTNKSAVFPEYIGIETKKVDVTNPDEFLNYTSSPALDAKEHNKSGEEEWKEILKDLKF